MCVDLLSLSRCSGEACTDSPDRFVSEDDLLEVLCREAEDCLFELSFYYFEVLSCFTLFLDFADAEDRSKTIVQRQAYLLGEDSTILVVVSTTLTVSEDDVASARRGDHRCRHFAGIGTFGLVCTVLCRNAKGATLGKACNGC